MIHYSLLTVDAILSDDESKLDDSINVLHQYTL